MNTKTVFGYLPSPQWVCHKLVLVFARIDDQVSIPF